MQEFFSLSQQEKQKIIKEIASFLKPQKEIVFAYIFGSFLDPVPITFRDIDIGIYIKETKKDSFDYETKLMIFLEKFLQLPVDIKILNSAPSQFQSNVFSKGQLLFCKNEKALTDLLESTSLIAVANEVIREQSFNELLTNF